MFFLTVFQTCQEGDNEKQFLMEPCLRLKRFLPQQSTNLPYLFGYKTGVFLLENNPKDMNQYCIMLL